MQFKDERELCVSDLEMAVQLVELFRKAGDLYEANPQLLADAFEECKLSLGEKNSRVPINRGFALIAIDDMVRQVCNLTGVERGLANATAAAALAPSKLKNVLDVFRAHWNDWRNMKMKAKTAKKP